MKKHVKFLTITALSVIIALAACSSPTDPPPTTIQQGTSFSVSGTFERDAVPGETESQTVKFKLTDEASYGRAAANSFAVKGELEDGDLVYRLKGTYDPDKLNYSVSADSSLIRYAINGLVDSEGKSAGSTATLLVKTELDKPDTWKAHTFVIDEPADGIEIDPTKEVKEDAGSGLPPEILGTWNAFESDTFEGTTYSYQYRMLINDWNINYTTTTTETTSNGEKKSFYDEQKLMIVDKPKPADGGGYDAIIGYQEYKTDAENEGEIIIEYFEDKGVPGVTALDTEPGSGNYPEGPAFYIHGDGSYSWYNFPPNQSNLFDEYFMTNYLEKALIKEGATPVTLFMKVKVVVSGNNKMTFYPYCEEIVNDPEFGEYPKIEEYTSVSEAETLSDTLYEDGGIIFTRQ